MTFRAASYSLGAVFHGSQTVIIDRGDGYLDVMTDADLHSAIQTVRTQRRRYNDEREFIAALSVYRGALEFLSQR